MSTLSQTLKNFAEIIEQIEENHGEITDEVLPHLQLAEAEIKQKVDNYVDFIDCVCAQAQKQAELKKKADDNIKMLKNLEERLKSNAKFLMESNNLIELQGEYRKMRLQNAGGQQAITHPENMFRHEKIIDEAFLGHFPLDSYSKKTVFVIDTVEFKHLVADGKVEACRQEERKKVIKLI